MFLRLGVLGLVGAIGVNLYRTRVVKRPQASEQRTSDAGAAGPSSSSGNTPPADASPLDELWQAAQHGDPAAVRRVLRRHAIQPDTAHNTTGTRLILDLARTITDSELVDSRLAQCLSVLSRAGWSLHVQSPHSGENALHILTAQQRGHKVFHRVNFFLAAELADPVDDNMLAAVSMDGFMPEEVATATRGELVAPLAVTRLQIQHALARQRAPPGPLQALQDAWLRIRGGFTAVQGGRPAPAAAQE